jgi:hypothetical protein
MCPTGCVHPIDRQYSLDPPDEEDVEEVGSVAQQAQRFSGVLEEDFVAPANTTSLTTSLTCIVNRLSGSIPSGLVQAEQIEMLHVLIHTHIVLVHAATSPTLYSTAPNVKKSRKEEKKKKKRRKA